ncbi:hypothetical protein EH221_00180 [bacterium]|nr:MAG: hypothetical protein EH221_00180 [bacterium]
MEASSNQEEGCTKKDEVGFSLTDAIRTFLNKYRPLIAWLVWGMGMSLFSGFVLHDFQTGFTIFMGFGIFWGLTLQFVTIAWLRRAACLICMLIAIIIVWNPGISFIQRILHKNISRNFLVDDVRQMASILESTHPDPYLHGGGKIAFHRRMQNLIRTIPEEGMTQTEFYRHLCPFLAAVGDGHTSFWLPFHLDDQSPGGIPLYFQAVEDFFYVAGVIDPEQKHLIGSKLLSVENISIDDLLKRQAQIKGYDNEYQLMRYLGYDGSLWYRKMLEHLIPEWKGESIHVVLVDPHGIEINLDLEPNNKGQDHLIKSETAVRLPSTGKSNYVYRFMDEEKKTVLLLIENMYTYRESFEMEMTLQGSLRKGLANDLYQKYNEVPPPRSNKELVAGIPSATELCRELVEVMKRNQSENLIMDLRRNQGGNAFISTIFFYFLYGKEALISFSDKRSIIIKKYSPLFWKQYPARDIDDINKHQPIKLIENDYDFSGYPEQGGALSREDSIRIIEEEASKAATFWEEYQSEKYSGYYRPQNILILCSPLTTSSGYAFMYDHWAAGGKVVGVPSSQAGNNFGAWVGFRLNYSWLKGGISHLYATHFRHDPDMGRVLTPDYEMNYDILKNFNFDSNAEIRYALKIIDDRLSNKRK